MALEKRPGGGFAATSMLRMLDPESRLRLRIFGLKLLFVVPVSMLLAANRGLPLTMAICFFCLWNSVFAGLAGLLQHQGYRATSLTTWDEAAAFLGLGLFAHLVAAAAA